MRKIIYWFDVQNWKYYITYKSKDTNNMTIKCVHENFVDIL